MAAGTRHPTGQVRIRSAAPVAHALQPQNVASTLLLQVHITLSVHQKRKAPFLLTKCSYSTMEHTDKKSLQNFN